MTEVRAETDAIMAEAERFVNYACDLIGYPPERSCILWAMAVRECARRRGRSLSISAGSAGFFRIRQSEDDGVINTHWSYVWSGEVVLPGYMPELHCWCWEPDTWSYVDATTRFLPQLSGEAGFPWTAPEPPPYLWSTSLPHRWHYEPDEAATAFVTSRAGPALLRRIETASHR